MSEPIFVDTSAWFAHVNRRDPEHRAVRDALEALRGCLVTSTHVFDETVTLCSYRLGHAAAVRVGEALLDPRVVALVRASASDEREAWTLFRERAAKTYSFTDCVSFTMMRRLGIATALALDEDFVREGFEMLPAAT